MLRCGVRNRGCALCATPVLYYGSFRFHRHRAGRGGCVSALRSPSRSLFPCCGRSVVRLRGRFEGRGGTAGGAPFSEPESVPVSRAVGGATARALGGAGPGGGRRSARWCRTDSGEAVCRNRRPRRVDRTAYLRVAAGMPGPATLSEASYRMAPFSDRRRKQAPAGMSQNVRSRGEKWGRFYDRIMTVRYYICTSATDAR